ncbi:hypothetical protein [Loktanella salsilacus]|uniref:hypothetical protein n=1 Tax=Loktanella salsilacus TaxID=195913 RepID=UPI003736A842
MTRRTPEVIASLVKKWDMRSIYELLDLIVELSSSEDEHGYKIDVEAYVDMTSLPTADIPDDIDTSYPVWAVDLDGYALVGDQANEIETIEHIREQSSC